MEPGGIVSLIQAASTSQLALAAFLSIAVAGIGYYFFKDAGVGARIFVFSVIVVFAFALSIRLIAPPAKADPVPTPTPQLDDPSPIRPRPDSPAPDTPRPQVEETEPPAPKPVKSAVIDLSGIWVDAGGISYQIEQGGSTFKVGGQFGTTIVMGQGAVIGRSVRWTYQNNIGGAGQCQGTLAQGDVQVTATCVQMNGPPYMVLLTKAG